MAAVDTQIFQARMLDYYPLQVPFIVAKLCLLRHMHFCGRKAPVRHMHFCGRKAPPGQMYFCGRKAPPGQSASSGRNGRDLGDFGKGESFSVSHLLARNPEVATLAIFMFRQV